MSATVPAGADLEIVRGMCSEELGAQLAYVADEHGARSAWAAPDPGDKLRAVSV